MVIAEFRSQIPCYSPSTAPQTFNWPYAGKEDLTFI